MTSKIKNALLIVLCSLFAIAMLTASLTFGRYSQEREPVTHGVDGVEYTVTNEVEVKTVEDLLRAIANGYAFIKLSDEMSNPLVMTTTVTDVGSDLVIDLNGHDLQRNSRDPMLNIKSGVTLTIIDSSKDQSGSFYNPVGSVLSIDGGTLTVATGKFESGPREKEYAKLVGTAGGWTTDIGGKITSETVTVDLFEKKNDGYAQTGNVAMPAIAPTVKATGRTDSENNALYYANGNMYFDKKSTYKINGLNGGNALTDTFLYYALDDTTVQNTDIFAAGSSADFYYSYYVEKSQTDGAPVYTPTSATTGENVFAVTVYGYYNVIQTAANRTGEPGSERFAAIGMNAGNLFVRGGEYHTYFGVPHAVCVRANGGVMSVVAGQFYAYDEGVCVRCNYSGRAGDEHLGIASGKFYAERGNAVEVTHGRMIVTGGTFEKRASASEGYDPDDNYMEHANGAGIFLSGGSSTLTIGNRTGEKIPFIMYGSGICAIHCDDGASVDATGATFTITKVEGVKSRKNNVGIYNGGGTVIVEDCNFSLDSDSSTGIISGKSDSQESGTVTVTSTVFEMGGNQSMGIYQSGGTTTVNSGVFSMTGEEVTGVFASDGTLNIGTSTSAEAYSLSDSVLFHLDHVANCYGVVAGGVGETTGRTGEEVTVNLLSAQFFIGQGSDSTNKHYYLTENQSKPNVANGINCAGIYSNQEKAVINVKRALFLVAGSYSAGIYANKGTITSSGTGANRLIVFAGMEYTGYQNGGYIETVEGTVTTRRWIFASRKESEFVQGTKFINFVATPAQGSLGVASAGGTIGLRHLYVNVHSVGANGLHSTGGNIKVGTLGADIIANRNDLLSVAAISVVGGNVEIGKMKFKTSGVGIMIENGNLKVTGDDGKGDEVNNESKESFIFAERSVAIYVKGTEQDPGEVHFGPASVLKIKCNIADAGTALGEGHAATGTPIPYKPEGDTTQDKGKEFYNGIRIEGGKMEVLGTLSMSFTGLNNDTSYVGGSGARFMKASTKSYAIYVLGGNFTATNKISVTSEVGGGIRIEDGNVVIGNANSALEDITVKTTGGEYSGAYAPCDWESSKNWYAPISLTGGHALTANGGHITIYNGTFDAAMGNGLRCVSATGDQSVIPTITIHNGYFNGKLGNAYRDLGKNTVETMTFADYMKRTYGTSAFQKATGPGVYYGMKVMGACNIHIYGGDFYGGNGGAFVTGVTAVASQEGKPSTNGTANVYVYAGKFVGDYDGFNIYDNSNVVFGAYQEGQPAVPEGSSSFNYKTAITVQSNAINVPNDDVYSVAVNPFNGLSEGSTVSFYYGTYRINSKSKSIYNALSTTFIRYNYGTDSEACLSMGADKGENWIIDSSWSAQGKQIFYQPKA